MPYAKWVCKFRAGLGLPKIRLGNMEKEEKITILFKIKLKETGTI